MTNLQKKGLNAEGGMKLVNISQLATVMRL